MPHRELQLIVDAGGRVQARRENGVEEESELALTPLHRNLISLFDDWLRSDSKNPRITRREELETLGSLLYATLLNGRVGGLFERSVKEATTEDRLRVQLVFGSDDTLPLARIPWEFLYYPDTRATKGFFFLAHPALILARYIPLSTPRPPLRVGRGGLKFLTVLSQPAGERPVMGRPVLDEIRRLCVERGLQQETLEDPTIERFRAALKRVQPHVLHFVGHGQYEQQHREGTIALLGRNGEAVWVTDDTFAEYFRNWVPRLVVLHACEGGHVDLSSNFAGLAPQLIRMKVPAVVAMQYPISNQTGLAFIRSFYDSLGNGEPVDNACHDARQAITLDNPRAYSSRDFGAPVLYMNSRDGKIIISKKAAVPGS
jgi:hypothetical protein